MSAIAEYVLAQIEQGLEARGNHVNAVLIHPGVEKT
jgi:hypothetical protein